MKAGEAMCDGAMNKRAMRGWAMRGWGMRVCAICGWAMTAGAKRP